MRSFSNGWVVIEAFTTAGTPTTACPERAGRADIADSSFESDADPAQLLFATLPSFQSALLHLNPDCCLEPEQVGVGRLVEPGFQVDQLAGEQGECPGIVELQTALAPFAPRPDPDGQLACKSGPGRRRNHHERAWRLPGGR
jgi:hypothetical protein